MPRSFISCATAPHAPSTWPSTPIVNGSGQRAARQIAQRLWAHGVEAFPVDLPDGHDPNSFFVHGGGDARQFQALLREGALMTYELIYRVDLGNAQSPFRVVAQTGRPRGGLDQPLFGPVLRPRLGLAHAARLCLSI